MAESSAEAAGGDGSLVSATFREFVHSPSSPPFAALLALPLPYVMDRVKNPEELSVLLHIALDTRRLDAVVPLLRCAQLQMNLLRTSREAVRSRPAPGLALEAVIGLGVRRQEHHMRVIAEDVSALCRSLLRDGDRLSFFIALNKAVAAEVRRAGLAATAEQKDHLFGCEELLQLRLRTIFAAHAAPSEAAARDDPLWAVPWDADHAAHRTIVSGALAPKREREEFSDDELLRSSAAAAKRVRTT